MYGSHINISKNIIDDIIKIHKLGGSIIQLYVSSFIDNKELTDEVLKITKKLKINIICHSSYSINIASNWDKFSWHIIQLLNEIKMSKKFDAPLIIHIGKQMNLTLSNAYNNMISCLIYIIKKTDHKILLETTSGQGTELCYKLIDLTMFFKKIIFNPILKNKIGICIDTCHLFSAGYDLRNPIKIKNFLETFDELIGLHYIQSVHLNDSKNEIGSKIDRHENIGAGYIGKPGLLFIYNYFIKLNIPIISETSKFIVL